MSSLEQKKGKETKDGSNETPMDTIGRGSAGVSGGLRLSSSGGGCGGHATLVVSIVVDTVVVVVVVVVVIVVVAVVVIVVGAVCTIASGRNQSRSHSNNSGCGGGSGGRGCSRDNDPLSGSSSLALRDDLLDVDDGLVRNSSCGRR